MTSAVVHSSQTDSAGIAETTPRFTDPSEAPGGSDSPSKSMGKRVGEGEDDNESTPNKKPKLLNKSQVSGAHEMQPQTHIGSDQEGVTSKKKALLQDPCLNLITNLNDTMAAFIECEKSPEGRQFAPECSRFIAHAVPAHILEVFVQAYLHKMWVEEKVRAYLSHFIEFASEEY